MQKCNLFILIEFPYVLCPYGSRAHSLSARLIEFYLKKRRNRRQGLVCNRYTKHWRPASFIKTHGWMPHMEWEAILIYLPPHQFWMNVRAEGQTQSFVQCSAQFLNAPEGPGRWIWGLHCEEVAGKPLRWRCACQPWSIFNYVCSVCKYFFEDTTFFFSPASHIS